MTADTIKVEIPIAKSAVENDKRRAELEARVGRVAVNAARWLLKHELPDDA